MRIVRRARGSVPRANRRPLQVLLVSATCAMSALFVLGLTVPAWGVASTLYVDQNNASCSDFGPGTQTQPYCTIGAGAAKAVAGQTVQVASGTYSENVTAKNSGTSGAPIVFTAAPGAAVTVSGQTHAFTISSKSWITVNGFNVTQTSGDGIYVSNSSFITISGNHASFAGQPTPSLFARGIRLSGSTNSVVSRNTVDHNTDAGIYVISGAAPGGGSNLITGNLAFANARQYTRAAPGIDVRTIGNTVSYNISHDNEDSGLQFYKGAANNLVLDNVCYKNGDHGIDDLGATGQMIVGNTVYSNVAAGINLEGGSSGGTLGNNISVDNGINSPRTKGNIRVDGTAIPGTTLDYDLVYLHSGSIMFVWGSVAYASVASFTADTGQEAHGIQADPKWVSPNTSDFHLSAGSAAIDSANSGAPGEPAMDADGSPRVDDPATPNTGVGPRAYDDRGAYEYQPPQQDQPPNAVLVVTPSTGPAPLNVTADASGSSDNDGTPIATYAFDFGDGFKTGPQPGPTAPHTYQNPGTYTVTVTVTDTANLSSQASQQVVVSSSNLVGNTGFEVDLSGWNATGTGIVLSRVAGGHSGSWSAQLTNGGAAPASCTLNDSPNWIAKTLPGTYTGSLWVRADSPGATLTLRFREYSGSTLLGSKSSQIVLSTSWQFVTVSYGPVTPGSTLDYNAYVSNAATGTCFYADDASITLN